MVTFRVRGKLENYLAIFCDACESLCVLPNTSLTNVCSTVSRVTTCLENLETSGNLKHVREMSVMLTVRELSGKNLVMEKCPKTVHYLMNICVHMGI